MSDRSHFVEGLIFGAVIGAIAGVLFAPRSGEETRKKLKKLKERQGPILENTKEKTKEMISQTIDAIETGFDKIGKMIDKKPTDGPVDGYPR